MLRIMLTYLIPLLLPVAAWFIWHKFFAKPPAPGEAAGPDQAPWLWLSLAGLVLMAASLGTFAVFSGNSPGAIYQPPEMIDGEIVPGRHVPAERR